MNALQIYEGSNGDATKALYAKLETLGPAGIIALNLFRAQKCSTRAKVYRGRGYKQDAYDRKNWSLGNLCKALEQSAAQLGIEWGWKQDEQQVYHSWVLYVEIPTGQVSFHASNRMCAKDYPGEWDQSGLSAERVVRWTQFVLDYQGLPGTDCEIKDGKLVGCPLGEPKGEEGPPGMDVRCPRCGNYIDPNTCYCGDTIKGGSHDNHSPIPMGCTCHFNKEDSAPFSNVSPQ